VITAWLRRLADRSRLQLHRRAMIAAVAAVHAATGDEFDRAREHATEVALCPDPLHCDHV
jgi:hypothetical protein